MEKDSHYRYEGGGGDLWDDFELRTRTRATRKKFTHNLDNKILLANASTEMSQGEAEGMHWFTNTCTGEAAEWVRIVNKDGGCVHEVFKILKEKFDDPREDQVHDRLEKKISKGPGNRDPQLWTMSIDALEKLQAEIARMEEEAARITKETEELEKKKDGKGTATGDSKSAGGAAGTGGSEAPSRDG